MLIADDNTVDLTEFSTL